MPRKFIATGTGRCGTGFLFKALNAAGIPAGHEDFFKTHRTKLTDFDLEEYAAAPYSDVSWLAGPHLRRFGLPVVHLVRHPFKVMNSFAYMDFFGNHRIHGAMIGYASKFLGYPADPVVATVFHWVAWNRLCELGDERLLIRLEDLDTPEGAARLMKFLDAPVLEGRFLEAARNTDHKYNRWPDYRANAISPEKALAIGHPYGLADKAAEYGYSL